MERGWIVIGIGGATCSGKTTLANEVHSKLPGSVLIHQDDYYYPMGSSNLEYVEEIKHYNWDVPSAIDFNRMLEDVKKNISTPMEMSVIIIEGTLVLNDYRIRNLCALKYYLTLPYGIGRQRRSQKSYEISDPPMNFERVVWPMYLKHKSELIDSSIKFIDSHDNNLTTIFCIILRDISKLFEIRKLNVSKSGSF